MSRSSTSAGAVLPCAARRWLFWYALIPDQKKSGPSMIAAKMTTVFLTFILPFISAGQRNSLSHGMAKIVESQAEAFAPIQLAIFNSQLSIVQNHPNHSGLRAVESKRV